MIRSLGAVAFGPGDRDVILAECLREAAGGLRRREFVALRRTHQSILAPRKRASSSPAEPPLPAIQYQLYFYGAEVLSTEYKRWMVDPSNPENPFHNLIGQESVKNKLARLAFQALGRSDHCARDLGLALLGPAGTGKTTFAKAFGRLLGLPFVELDPKRLRRTEDVFQGIARVLEDFPVPAGHASIALQPRDDGSFKAPPCIVFIDEVHQLVSKVEQGLLAATENNTHRMETETGTVLDTDNVCWMIATTDRGLLFDAFDTRFSKVVFKSYTREDIARIIRVHHPMIPAPICQAIARYAGSVTREVLDFAVEVVHQVRMARCSWGEAVQTIRREHGIYEFGMTEQRREILKALAERGPIALARLHAVAQVKAEELQKYTLPPLLEATAEREALIGVGSRGFFITEAGLAELKRRGILR
jgi:Holliday junction resolvasome RuvABC ATP-dependent DNA helicase subunit